MSRPHPHVRRLLGVVAAIGLALGVVTALIPAAQAAKPPAVPTATAGAVVDGTSGTVTVTVIVDAAPNKIPGATCLLDSADASCGTKTAYGTNRTKYTATYSGLAAGHYVFVFDLWVGTAASHTLAPIADTAFDVAGTPATPADVCASVSGVFTDGFSAWHCAWPDGTTARTAPPADLCWDQGGVPSLSGSPTTLNCLKAVVVQAKTLCSGLAGYSFSANDSGRYPSWSCETTDLAADPAPFEAACTTMAGYWSFTAQLSGRRYFSCSQTLPPF